MHTLQSRIRDKMFLAGFFMIILSMIIFSLPFLFTPSYPTDNFFVMNFVLTAVYFVMLLISQRMREGRDGLALIFQLLILGLISAYSLNRSMNVFEESVDWLSVLLVLTAINHLAFSIIDSLPKIVKNLMFFLMGISICLFSYMSFFVIPYYVIGAVGAVLLGVSLHIFVPLAFVLFTIKLFRRHTPSQRNLRLAFYSGIAEVIAMLIVFVTFWAEETNKINTVFRRATVNNDALPPWVTVAQRFGSNWLDEKLVKASLVYAVMPENDFFWRMPSRNFDEKHQHDPLVTAAVFISGKLDLTEDDRIKVLESMYDSRHQAQNRLWAGDDLLTTYVNTNVRIWPEYRLAYTEKTIFITNTKSRERWGRPGEAIYTFHLPEGGVVSSLSLWIDGKEQKGILTTKEKAEKAYDTIVGVLNRDPSVVHWQEGNTVSVRVFPINTGESRTFKIGITAPLEKSGNSLVYQNIHFDGPPSSSATEDLAIAFNKPQKNITTPEFVSNTDDQHYNRSGAYRPNWTFQFADPGISPLPFSFNGRSYKVENYQPQRADANFSTIYLDINSSWSRVEFEKVFEMTKTKKVLVYADELIELDLTNKDRLYHQLSLFQFSLFPFYKIANPAASLVISKNAGSSPNLADLKNSDFIRDTKAFLQSAPPVRIFHIGNDLSPYLKSMLEYRVIDFEHGDFDLLNDLLKKNQFAVNQENQDLVVIYGSSLQISRTGESAPSMAPDHLMRLFAYNHIMQTAGRKMLSEVPEEDQLVEAAKESGIVTPVSSLVVLETQADYDRFNIAKNIGGLGNASLKSKGAVPEPHEWFLILAALLVFVYFRFKSQNKYVRH